MSVAAQARRRGAASTAAGVGARGDVRKRPSPWRSSRTPPAPPARGPCEVVVDPRPRRRRGWGLCSLPGTARDPTWTFRPWPRQRAGVAVEPTGPIHPAEVVVDPGAPAMAMRGSRRGGRLGLRVLRARRWGSRPRHAALIAARSGGIRARARGRSSGTPPGVCRGFSPPPPGAPSTAPAPRAATNGPLRRRGRARLQRRAVAAWPPGARSRAGPRGLARPAPPGTRWASASLRPAPPPVSWARTRRLQVRDRAQGLARADGLGQLGRAGCPRGPGAAGSARLRRQLRGLASLPIPCRRISSRPAPPARRARDPHALEPRASTSWLVWAARPV